MVNTVISTDIFCAHVLEIRVSEAQKFIVNQRHLLSSMLITVHKYSHGRFPVIPGWDTLYNFVGPLVGIDREKVRRITKLPPTINKLNIYLVSLPLVLTTSIIIW